MLDQCTFTAKQLFSVSPLHLSFSDLNLSFSDLNLSFSDLNLIFSDLNFNFSNLNLCFSDLHFCFSTSQKGISPSQSSNFKFFDMLISPGSVKFLKKSIVTTKKIIPKILKDKDNYENSKK